MENSVVPQKLKIELPCDWATSRLGIYPEKNMVQQDTDASVHYSPSYNIQDVEAA